MFNKIKILNRFSQVSSGIFPMFWPDYKAAYSGLPREAWLLSFVVLVNRAGSMVLFFMTLYLTSQLNFTVFEAGRMISVYGLGALLGTFLGGWLCDIIGPIKVQILSLCLSAIGFILLVYLDSAMEIAVFLFLLAIVAEAFRPANSTAISLFCPPEIRTRGYALNRLAINLGITIGPALGGLLATYNYTLLFWVDGLTCLCAAILLFFFLHASRYKIKIPDKQQTDKSIQPWRDKDFLMVLFLLLLTGLIFTQLFNTWPLYLKQVKGFMENGIGLLFALNAVLIVLIEMPLVHKFEKKKPLRVMAVGSLFFSCGFALLPFGRNTFFIAFTVILWTIGEMLVFPLVSAYIANLATDSNRGRYMGMFSFTFSLAFVIGPALGTWIYDTLSPAILWYSVGGLGIVIWFGFLFFDRISEQKIFKN